jgi:hypothetical protein
MLLLHWGYIVTFTKVLTIYHIWIHPHHHFSLSPTPSSHSWNTFNRFLCCDLQTCFERCTFWFYVLVILVGILTLRSYSLLPIRGEKANCSITTNISN